MEKKYQVFVSSTYEDLIAERQEVMHALLELDCMPSGMELFPAADDDQWGLIKQVIDDCDYYVVIIGGRYGSLGPDGVSYTQMEYEYAVSQNKPVIAFLHKNPDELQASKTEKTEKGRKQLEAFRDLAQKKVCKYWATAADLGSVVSRSLVKLIKTKPAVGWVRADLVPDQAASQEILNLKKRIEELEGIIEKARTEAPSGTEELSQGEDSFSLRYTYETGGEFAFSEVVYASNMTATWNKMFSTISPILIDEASESSIKEALNQFIYSTQFKKAREAHPEVKRIKGFRINNDDFQTIKIQLRALGLITQSRKTRSVKDTATYWTLTPYGDTVMTRLRALKRKE